MPYFPILQKPTQNNLITKTSFRQDAPPRRGATALFHNPVCKAQRSVPGFSSTPTSACRRYATSPPPIVLRIHIVRHPSVCPIGAMHHLHRRKTAEERFHMLARGWLAYPVTPKHHPSTAEERLYTSTHGRFALSRRRATALFRNPVRKAQRSVPGFSSTPTSACRRYATSPPSAVASPHRPPSPIVLRHRRKNRRRAVSYVSTGLACLPRDTDARATTAEERLWKPEASKKRPMVGIPTIGLCIATFCCAITC